MDWTTFTTPERLSQLKPEEKMLYLRLEFWFKVAKLSLIAYLATIFGREVLSLLP